MMNELATLEEVTHPNIMPIYELLENDDYYFIVGEYLRYGGLFDYLSQVSQEKAGKIISEHQVMTIVQQVMYAVNYMHKNGIAHRDIKPENILLENK